MSSYGEGKNRLSRMLQWQDSDEYKAACINRHKDCERLLAIGKEYLRLLRLRSEEIRGNVVKVEYATGGDIHRGFYCPSPVLDIIIGNVHRGRILKRVMAQSKINHRFGFDARHRLIYTEALVDGIVSSTEYLFVQDNFRFGITIQSAYELVSISEEVFENQKLTRYSHLSVYPDQDGYFCSNLYVETYLYDVQGLKSSEKEEYQPYVNVLHKYHYDFERENGYLSTYTVVDCSIEGEDVWQIDSPVYVVRMKRKA